jgi:putative transposase
MCKVFKVSRSSYYEYLKGSVSQRAQLNEKLLVLIQEVHQKSKQRYGSPRIYQALKARNIAVSRPRVARLMKQAQIRAKMKRSFKATTDSKHGYAMNENLLARNFTAPATGQAWVSDITYIRTLTGWLYLTVVLASRPKSNRLGPEPKLKSQGYDGSCLKNGYLEQAYRAVFDFSFGPRCAVCL